MTFGRLSSWRLFLSGLLAFVTLSVVIAPNAGAASSSYNIPPGSWPFPASSTRGDAIGANCNFDVHNLSGSAAPLQWDASHSLQITYRCEVLSPDAYSGGGGSNEPFIIMPLVNSASTHYTTLYIPMARGGDGSTGGGSVYLTEAAGAATTTAQTFGLHAVGGVDCCAVKGSLDNFWYTADGTVTVPAASTCNCDAPVNGGAFNGGYHSQSGGLNATLTPVDVRLGNSGYSGSVCNGSYGGCPATITTFGTGAWAVPIRGNVTGAGTAAGALPVPTSPNGSTLPQTSPGCKLATLTVVGKAAGTGALTGAWATSQNEGFLHKGDGLIITTTIAVNTPPGDLYLAVTNVQEMLTLTYNRPWPGSSGSDVLDYTAPNDGFYGVRAGCAVNGTETDAIFYGSGSDSAHGPGVQGAGPGVVGVGNPGDGTDNGSVIGCFAAFVQHVSFLGVSVPWPDLLSLPSDMLCFVQRLVIGTGSQWSAQLDNMRADFDSSPLHAVTTLAAVPLSAWSAFSASYDNSSTGCTGPSADVPMLTGTGTTSTTHTLSPFSTCDSHIATVATLVRESFTLGLWIAFAWFAFHRLGRAFGFGSVTGGDE